MPSPVNMRSPTIKRILQEMKEIRELMQQQPNQCPFAAEALEDDVYQWCFAIRGPKDSPFERGIYHGRILLPPEYPFKPPSFIMLSPSGRFETNTKICLSISSYHPEQWQPSWSMRTALTALIAFFPSPAKGAVGSQEATDTERAQMALESREKVPQVASAERMEVMRRLHMFLSKQDDNLEGTVVSEDQVTPSKETQKEKEEQQQEDQQVHQTERVPDVPQIATPTIQHAPLQQQQQVSGWRQGLQVCMTVLDKVIVIGFTVLGIFVAWNVLK